MQTEKCYPEAIHPAKFDNVKDEKISDFKTVAVSQRKNLLDNSDRFAN